MTGPSKFGQFMIFMEARGKIKFKYILHLARFTKIYVIPALGTQILVLDVRWLSRIQYSSMEAQVHSVIMQKKLDMVVRWVYKQDVEFDHEGRRQDAII
jgi:hypothetical protein